MKTSHSHRNTAAESHNRQPDNLHRHIMIVAGEASGDLHGANLVRALQEQRPELTFSGLGGSELKSAGVDILFEASRIAVVGVFEVFGHLGDILKARTTLLKEMREKKPALLILIDFPDFNLLLAAQAKKLGIPVFYYISPQIWAWRTRRVHKIGRLTDRVGVILPFEKEFYARHGYTVDYVGHPLLDTVVPVQSSSAFRKAQKVPDGNTCIGIIPGSRTKEIRSLLKVFLDAAGEYARQSSKPCTFFLPRASTVSMELLQENGLEQASREMDIRVIDQNRYDMMAACDAVLAASGTVTLELAILNVPMVAAYRVSPRTYFLGRLLIRGLRFFSLVNLIAGKKIIPELLQDEVTPRRLVTELDKLINEKTTREVTLTAFSSLRSALGSSGASQRAASIVLEMLDER